MAVRCILDKQFRTHPWTRRQLLINYIPKLHIPHSPSHPPHDLPSYITVPLASMPAHAQARHNRTRSTMQSQRSIHGQDKTRQGQGAGGEGGQPVNPNPPRPPRFPTFPRFPSRGTHARRTAYGVLCVRCGCGPRANCASHSRGPPKRVPWGLGSRLVSLAFANSENRWRPARLPHCHVLSCWATSAPCAERPRASVIYTDGRSRCKVLTLRHEGCERRHRVRLTRGG